MTDSERRHNLHMEPVFSHSVRDAIFVSRVFLPKQRLKSRIVDPPGFDIGRLEVEGEFFPPELRNNLRQPTPECAKQDDTK